MMMDRERLADALRDENGLPPTDIAMDVLAVVVEAIETTDELWAQPATPPSVEYARSIINELQSKWNLS